MIKAFCIAGQPQEIVEQLRELERQGLNAINFSAPLHNQYRISEDFARRVMSLSVGERQSMRRRRRSMSKSRSTCVSACCMTRLTTFSIGNLLKLQSVPYALLV